MTTMTPPSRSAPSPDRRTARAPRNACSPPRPRSASTRRSTSTGTRRRSPGSGTRPPERSTLYGTDLWRRMPEEQRIELTKHEVASIASVGIWFETILTQMLVRSLYDRSMTDAHARFAFTEIADECRHSMMFGRMIETLGCPDYGPGRFAHALGRPVQDASRTPR